MITNTRLLELRTTGLDCEKKVIQGNATHLEKEYATLYRIVCDGIGKNLGMGANINTLFGK